MVVINCEKYRQKKSAGLSQQILMVIRLTQNYQSFASINGLAFVDTNFCNGTIARSHDFILHLHSFQHDQHIAGLNSIASLEINLADLTGHRSCHSSCASRCSLRSRSSCRCCNGCFFSFRSGFRSCSNCCYFFFSRSCCCRRGGASWWS